MNASGSAIKGSGKDRVTQFREHVAALNRQFADWCTAQVDANGDKFLMNGVADYLRHSAKLRLEFAEVLSSDDGSASPEGDSPAAAAGRRTYAPLLSLMPLAHTKTVHFIRHGEGWHNVGISNTDAHLTPKGWDQAHALRRHMQAHAATRGVQLVLVSPLMRTLETAAGVFGAAEGERVLMAAQSEAADERTAHALVLARYIQLASSAVTFSSSSACLSADVSALPKSGPIWPPLSSSQ